MRKYGSLLDSCLENEVTSPKTRVQHAEVGVVAFGTRLGNVGAAIHGCTGRDEKCNVTLKSTLQ